MKRIKDAAAILAALGLPKAQQNERSALTLLALAGLRPKTPWSSVSTPLLRTVDMMDFMREAYGKDYAANTRETIRRQTLHQFEQARIVDRNPDDPNRPTNSGKTAYRLTPGAAKIIAAFGIRQEFDAAVAEFSNAFGSLDATYRHARSLSKVPLTLPGGKEVVLSAGAHNELQVAVVREFAPRFAPNAQLLYMGDTAKKQAVLASDELAKLGVAASDHDKLPDIILFRADRNWLYLIEAVTSHGPVSPKRHHELEAAFGNASADRVYVTAFPSAADFRRYAADIAWETEVWLADRPDHMIHFNGEKFLGPYRSD